MFKQGDGNWTTFRSLDPKPIEVDFHYPPGQRELSYWEAMGEVWSIALTAIKEAYENGDRYVLFRHGSSTSGPFKTTSRSVVRRLMRSKDATPYIIKARSIQHYSVFLAEIRKKPGLVTVCARK